jgi:hypothetical protein
VSAKKILYIGVAFKNDEYDAIQAASESEYTKMGPFVKRLFMESFSGNKHFKLFKGNKKGLKSEIVDEI